MSFVSSRAINTVLTSGEVQQEVMFHRGSISVTYSAGRRSSATFKVRGRKFPEWGTLGCEVGIYDRGRRIFGGTVAEMQREPIVSRPGAEAWVICTCDDWVAALQRNHIDCYVRDVADDGFDYDWDAAKVLNDILTNHGPDLIYTLPYTFPDGTPIGAKVDAGAFGAGLHPIYYQGVSVADAIDDLARKSNYVWGVTPERGLFFCPYYRSFRYINSTLKNYRSPVILQSNANRVSGIIQIIGYEAVRTEQKDFNALLTYPKFIIRESGEWSPVIYMDKVQEIALNGAAYAIAERGSDQRGDIYWRRGSPVIWWDKRTPPPNEKDILTVKFWRKGSIVVGSGTGDTAERAHTYGPSMFSVDHPEMTKLLDAQVWEAGFKATHSGGDEFRWRMYSHELLVDGAMPYELGIFPGDICYLGWSTPSTDPQTVIVQSLTITDMLCEPPVFAYDIVATNYGESTKAADEVQFLETLAEIPRKLPKAPLLEENPNCAGWNYDALVTGTSGYEIQLDVGLGNCFRCAWAVINAKTCTAGISADILWKEENSQEGFISIFLDAEHHPTLDADATQGTQQSMFSTYPLRLYLPHRATLQLNVESGAGTYVQIKLLGKIVSINEKYKEQGFPNGVVQDYAG